MEKQKTKQPKNQHQTVLWYLFYWNSPFSLREVIKDSMFFKFQTRLGELEQEYGVLTNKTNHSFINRFGRKSTFKMYEAIDKYRILYLFNTLQLKEVQVEFEEVN